jgi:hypothetical protein
VRRATRSALARALRRARWAIGAFALAWLALPSAVAADNCSDWSLGEIATCPNYAMLKTLAFLASAAIAAAAALRPPPRPRISVEKGARLPDGSIAAEPFQMSADDWDALADEPPPSWLDNAWNATKDAFRNDSKYEMNTERNVSGVRG